MTRLPLQDTRFDRLQRRVATGLAGGLRGSWRRRSLGLFSPVRGRWPRHAG